ADLPPPHVPPPSIVFTFRPLRRPSASPFSRMKNWRPGSSSRISCFPSGRSISSAILAISPSAFFDKPAKRGTCLRCSILLSVRLRIARILRREQLPRLLGVPLELHRLEAGERLLDQRAVAANLAERPQRKRREERALASEYRGRLILDRRPIPEPNERIEPRDVPRQRHPVRQFAAGDTLERKSQLLEGIDVVPKERQPETRTAESQLVPPHAER